ncbi:hypothetical protein [Halobacteriovorax sp. HLS]|uniref:hypothetical protein n=1 Tax=Halobacteriovorax sp. HLS TaxID=2234000 RepID=UPI000FD6BBC7|nr:hypothetical protein [Halobacteriovorax sp. HLS]
MKKGIVLLSLLVISLESYSMGIFRPREPKPDPDPPVQTPTDPPPTTTDPTPDPNPGPVPIDFIEVANIIGPQVDSQYGSYKALDTLRIDSMENQMDYCEAALDDQDKFSQRIAFFVEMQLLDSKVDLGNLAPYYAVPRNNDDFIATGLAQSPLCISTRSSLTKTLKKSDRVPSSSVIAKLNDFENEVNGLRQRMNDGEDEARMLLTKKWTKFFSCLAYTESLSSADSSSSNRVAAKYAPANYRKPAGVKFYEDPYQDEASKLNIGMFQFTPNGGGNIGACIGSWNEFYPQCSFSKKSSRSSLIEYFGSTLQTVNAFCGVNKVVQTFSIQTNSTKSTAYHPANSGVAKADRCVTPWIYSGYAYNHFGPLMNSTKKNLSSLISCISK